MDVKSSKPPVATGLPMSRVKIIMKSSPDVDHISPDALFAMTKATELFVAHLSNETFKNNDKKGIEYCELANVVNNDDIFGFLQEVIPHKITVREYWKLIGKVDEDDDSEKSSSESE
ncbi:chromatin accessibility complex protein 1-like [Clavelina lepadiformis]|uniref:Transcription factor CBF/NF-Y/archaeal histone domain-containing protein n=1 Tax=Clavelina lepadiformis TaxID=159417 RepID=A0ABP0FWP3_CLALP